MFQGFSKKTGEFLWELAFNNERPWFLAHKDEFEEYVNAPFKALAGECFALMEQRYPALDCRVHVSRIYRDARRLFGRGPYKDHLWFSIKASQVLLEGPMFWFEVGAADYSYGMGFYSATPAQMEAFRRSIDANPERFRRIVEQGKELGAAAELPPPLQVDMAAVLPQMTGGCIIAALFLPALAVLQGGNLTGLHAAVNGITMGVKIGYHRVNLLIEKHF